MIQKNVLTLAENCVSFFEFMSHFIKKTWHHFENFAIVQFVFCMAQTAPKNDSPNSIENNRAI